MHPFRSFRALTFWGFVLCAVAAAAMNGPLAEPSRAQRKPSPNDCLFKVTVFTEAGWALYGAEVRIHPAGKKKPVWEEMSDHQGNIAVRVPPVGDYEFEVKVKGYVPQTKKATAIQADQVDLVFNMVPKPKKKP